MKQINEVVDLPSVEERASIHPLDVPPARRPFLTSWWLRRLASLPVAFLLGALLWVITGNVVSTVVAPIVMLTMAALAAEYFAGQAWQFIPRKRMDRGRDSSALPQLAASFIDAIALVSGLLILVAWFSTRDYTEIEQFTIGTGAGIAVLQLVEVIVAAARRPRNWVAVASRLLTLAAVVLAVLVASAILVGDQWTTEAINAALMGGAMVVAIQLVWWLIHFVGSRRSAGAGEA